MTDKPKSRVFAEAVGVVYVVGFVVYVVYYNWQFAHKFGFWPWLFLGEIVPTLEAAAWPIDFIKCMILGKLPFGL